MRLSAEYRREAAEKVKPYAGTLAIICLIYTAIIAVINISFKETQMVGDVQIEIQNQPISFLMIFVGGQFALSWNFISQKINLNEKIEIKDLFFGFKDYKRGFVSYLLIDVYLALWGLITLGIGAIVKSYSYAMTYFLLQEDKTLGSNEAITLSRKLMDGNKWRLFCLEFSYIGWYILSIFTLGILNLWITPRVNEARYLFMKDVYEQAGYTLQNNDSEVVIEVPVTEETTIVEE